MKANVSPGCARDVGAASLDGIRERILLRSKDAGVIARLFVLIVAGLFGCGHYDNTLAVAAQKAQAIHRNDRFDAIAIAGSHVVAATLGGAVLASEDGGNSWMRAEIPQPASVIAISTCPDGNFVALDFYRKVWTQKGREWTPHPISIRFDPGALTCDPAGRIWVTGSRTGMAVSADGGANWVASTLDQDAILTAIQFFDGNSGIAIGEFGTVALTADGGTNWKLSQSSLPSDFYPYSMQFSDRLHGWVSGVAGALMFTTDGGRSWAPAKNPANAPIYSIGSSGTTMFGGGAGGALIRLEGSRWSRVDADHSNASEYTAVAVGGDGSVIAAGGADLRKIDSRSMPAAVN